LEKANAKHNGGYQEDGSGEPVSRSEIYAKLSSAIARRAAEVQSRKLLSEQVPSSATESQPVSIVDSALGAVRPWPS
jgi:hypothetical protein